MEAANGETKRVNAKGEIAPPTLSQRRQAPRVEVRLPCRLVLPDLNLPSLLFDVSRDGVGIIRNHPLLDRQAVSVEPRDGRLLNAIVVRRDGDREGLSLLKPLASDDPLFGRRSRPAIDRGAGWPLSLRKQASSQFDPRGARQPDTTSEMLNI